MSATDELRELLEERGVEWTYSIGPFPQTNWEVGDVTWHAKELEQGFDVSTRYITAKQAVEATLGRGTCKAVPLEDNEGLIYKGQMVCSECGCYLGKNTMITRDGEFGRPNFCPNCGRRVVL